MSPSVDALYKAMKLVSPCVRCSKPVREGHAYCDAWCRVQHKRELERGKK